MTFFEHLNELRIRLTKSALMLSFAMLACVFLYDDIIGYMTVPHYRAMEQIHKEIRPGEPFRREDYKFLAGQYGSPFATYFKLALIAGLFISSPYILYQAWEFVRTGLYARERRFVTIFGLMSFTLFIAGCIFGYFVLIPIVLYFLAVYANPQFVDYRYTISEYLDFVLLMTVIVGLVFQLPVIMSFLSAVGIFTWKTFLSYWRLAIVLIFIFAAIVTPPDVVSQTLVGVPMTALYFLGVGMAYVLGKKNVS